MILLLLFFFFVNSSFSKKKTNNEVEEQQRRNNSFYPEKRKLFTFFVFRFTFSFSIVRNISKKLKWMKKKKQSSFSRKIKNNYWTIQRILHASRVKLAANRFID